MLRHIEGQPVADRDLIHQDQGEQHILIFQTFLDKAGKRLRRVFIAKLGSQR